MGKIIKFGLLGLLTSGLAGGGYLFFKEFPKFWRERRIENIYMETKSDKCPNGQYYMGACRDSKKEMGISTLLERMRKAIPF